MAEFITKCPHCNAELQAQDEWNGMEVECPMCKNNFMLSMPLATTPSQTSSLKTIKKIIIGVIVIITIISVITAFLFSKKDNSMSKNIADKTISKTKEVHSQSSLQPKKIKVLTKKQEVSDTIEDREKFMMQTLIMLHDKTTPSLTKQNLMNKLNEKVTLNPDLYLPISLLELSENELQKSRETLKKGVVKGSGGCIFAFMLFKEVDQVTLKKAVEIKYWPAIKTFGPSIAIVCANKMAKNEKLSPFEKEIISLNDKAPS